MTALYAHRLGRAYGPDNSLEALAGSLRAGVEGVETDVCLTADGELVLLHDPYVPGTGFAHELPASALGGRRDGGRAAWMRSRRALGLQLEVKAHADAALAMRTVDALAARVRRDFELLSFSAPVCAHAAALGLRARLVIWADYAPAALARWARRHRVAGVCVEHFLLSAELVAALRGAGLSLTTGTVSDPALYERVLAFGPDAVTTDAPHALRGAVTRRAA